ncbi:DNA recombination protein RmuC [Desulfoluna spongiiphila]|uniref:DNA recombination protein RmuC n=1 Tax=Desulfoluna spongiiphila TaxID=419481 RepID=A0A1G5GW93_9BACT|nr:DNA recombination protein RmuC [Desulfoluna spongiiphila]SCY55440.1 DNA recombination protein RmuC [Desulfoluna spongiiphila]
MAPAGFMDILIQPALGAGLVAGAAVAWGLAGVRFRRTTRALDEALESRDAQEERLFALADEAAEARGRLTNLLALEEGLKERDAALHEKGETEIALRSRMARLEAELSKERESTAEKVALLSAQKDELRQMLKALSADALADNAETFTRLSRETLEAVIGEARRDFTRRGDAVKEIVAPVTEAMKAYDEKVRQMEMQREKAYGALTEQVETLARTHAVLQKETTKLSGALQVPNVRGRWGEITLKRVAELSGMVDRCDFYEQVSMKGEAGAMRPDMVVQLPGGRRIAVDSKVPLAAYLRAMEATTEGEKATHLDEHARALHHHVQVLSGKAYWAGLKPAPEFVVLFIPGESFFSAALSKRPGLIEEGIEKGVVLATPTTLISLLKAVGYGWRQEQAAESVHEIQELGKELYSRMVTFASHLNKLGGEIGKVTSTYNQLAGSFERRLFVSARRFEELGVREKETATIDSPDPVETVPRRVEAG